MLMPEIEVGRDYLYGLKSNGSFPGHKVRIEECTVSSIGTSPPYSVWVGVRVFFYELQETKVTRPERILYLWDSQQAQWLLKTGVRRWKEDATQRNQRYKVNCACVADMTRLLRKVFPDGGINLFEVDPYSGNIMLPRSLHHGLLDNSVTFTQLRQVLDKVVVS